MTVLVPIWYTCNENNRVEESTQDATSDLRWRWKMSSSWSKPNQIDSRFRIHIQHACDFARESFLKDRNSTTKNIKIIAFGRTGNIVSWNFSWQTGLLKVQHGETKGKYTDKWRPKRNNLEITSWEEALSSKTHHISLERISIISSSVTTSQQGLRDSLYQCKYSTSCFNCTTNFIVSKYLLRRQYLV